MMTLRLFLHRSMALLLLFVAMPAVSAQPMPEGLTAEEQKLNQYILDYIKVLRVTDMQPPPPQVERFQEKYTEYCRQRAELEYGIHGRWFYCEDHQEFRDDIRWDEVVTYRVYCQLLAQSGDLEMIPNYTKENRQQAIEFWQSWQQEDGSFGNYFIGKGDSNSCNGKYIPGLLDLLGSSPLHETSGYGAAELNTEKCLSQIADRQMNHGTATASVMLRRIHEGETEYIPILERAVELAVAQLSPHTGMFHGPTGKPSGSAWSGYGTTAESMKGMTRLIGYMGVENMPYRHVRADTLIENQEWFRKAPVSVKRNTAEMMVQCLMEASYRHEELLRALDAHSKVIMEGEPWNSHITGDYTAYVLRIFGPYLNWEGYDGQAPRTRFSVGAEYDWRVEVGPFGRSVNVIRKASEELLWHKDWTYAGYGLRARNAAHEKRKIIDVVLASGGDWTQSTDDQGRTVLTRTLRLGQTLPANPYLKFKWSGGDVEILLNDVLVKKKLGGLPDYGAVHIPQEARNKLRPGKNILQIRTAAKVDAMTVSAGLIDWTTQ